MAVRYFELKPHPVLADYVKCLWFLEKDYSADLMPIETVLPDGCLDFVFQAGEIELDLLIDGQIIRQPLSFVIGPQKEPVSLTSTGKTITLGIRFYAYGAHPFLRLSLKKLTNKTTDLEPLFGKTVSDLAERVRTVPPSAALRELENFLMAQLPTSKVDVGQIKAATTLLFQQQGATDITDLADYTNLSLRTLERKFEEAVGYSPKTFARIVRFDHLKNELMLNPTPYLTDLAYRYGYFDQAHFIRDFKQFTGKTPSAFTEDVANRQIYFYK